MENRIGAGLIVLGLEGCDTEQVGGRSYFPVSSDNPKKLMSYENTFINYQLI